MRIDKNVLRLLRKEGEFVWRAESEVAIPIPKDNEVNFTMEPPQKTL